MASGRGDEADKDAGSQKGDRVKASHNEGEGNSDEGDGDNSETERGKDSELPEGFKIITHKFKLIKYNGGEDAPAYGIQNVFQDEGIHCSQPGKNFDLVLKFDDPRGCILTTVMIRGSSACSAPIKNAIIFASETNPVKKLKYSKAFDGVQTLEQYNTKLAACDAKNQDQPTPVGYLETDKESLEGVLSLSPWRKCVYVHIRLLGPHADNNIDIERIHLVGIPADSPQFATESKVPRSIEIGVEHCRSLGACRMPLQTFNQFRFDLMERIQLNTSALLFLNTPLSEEEIAAMNWLLGELGSVCEEEWEGSGLVFYYHVFDIDTSDPTSQAALFLKGLFVSQEYPNLVFGIRENDGTRYMFSMAEFEREREKKRQTDGDSRGDEAIDRFQMLPGSLMAWCESYAKGQLKPHFKTEGVPCKLQGMSFLPNSLAYLVRTNFETKVGEAEFTLLCVHYGGLSASSSASILATAENRITESEDGNVSGVSEICVISCVVSTLESVWGERKGTEGSGGGSDCMAPSHPVRCALLDLEANDAEDTWFPLDDSSPPYFIWFSKETDSKRGKKKKKGFGGLQGQRKESKLNKGSRVRSKVNVASLVKYIHKKLPKNKKFSLNKALDVAMEFDDSMSTRMEAMQFILLLDEDGKGVADGEAKSTRKLSNDPTEGNGAVGEDVNSSKDGENEMRAKDKGKDQKDGAVDEVLRRMREILWSPSQGPELAALLAKVQAFLKNEEKDATESIK